jgi:CHAT domain-containing protein
MLAGSPEWLILPDDRLWDLPFQALLTPRQTHLIEEKPLSYAPSFTSFSHLGLRPAPPPNSSVAVFANPPSGGENLPPLLRTEQLARDLLAFYHPPRATIFTGPAASEDEFKRALQSAGILQFAGHGILRDDEPIYSYLRLGPSANSDGLFEAWELLESPITPRLVVLTGCETARGQFGSGEGLIGLSWTFLISGARSLLATQWKIEEAVSAELTLAFHRSLAPSVSPARALQAAARSIASRPTTRHPFYWAGFTLLGASW